MYMDGYQMIPTWYHRGKRNSKSFFFGQFLKKNYHEPQIMKALQTSGNKTLNKRETKQRERTQVQAWRTKPKVGHKQANEQIMHQSPPHQLHESYHITYNKNEQWKESNNDDKCNKCLIPKISHQHNELYRHEINLLVRNGEGSMLMQQGGMQSKELGLESFPKNI